MYDSLRLYGYSDNGFNLSKYLTNPRINTDYSTGEITSINGKVNNLNCRLMEKGLSINGSLSKYYFGDNLRSLTRKDTELAIEKLSDELHFDIKESNVNEIHIAHNFNVKQPIINYYYSLGELKHFKRSEIANETLYYLSKSNKLIFYDKLAEMKNKKEPIPDFFDKTNILRYELRSMRPKKMLKMDQLSGKHLFSENTYVSLMEKWKDYYFQIKRKETLKVKEQIEFDKPSDLKTFLAVVGLTQIDKSYLLNYIETLRTKKNRQTISRLKQAVNELFEKTNFTEPNDAAKELDKLVNQAVQYYR